MSATRRILPRLSVVALFAVQGLVWAVPMRAHGVTRYDNGRWFDGKAFVPGTYYSIDGRLLLDHAGDVDAVVDLNGGFVISRPMVRAEG